MDVGGGEKYVNSRAYRGMQRLCRALDVMFRGTRQRRNNWTRHGSSHGLNRGEIAVGCDRKSRLNNIYPQAVELTRQADLFLHIHTAARRLLAVAQSRIKNRNSIAVHHKLPLTILPILGQYALKEKLIVLSNILRTSNTIKFYNGMI